MALRVRRGRCGSNAVRTGTEKVSDHGSATEASYGNNHCGVVVAGWCLRWGNRMVGIPSR